MIKLSKIFESALTEEKEAYIPVSNDQIKKLDKLFKKLGSDIFTSIVVSDDTIEEKIAHNFMQLDDPEEIAQHLNDPKFIIVDRDLEKEVQQLIDAASDAINWYQKVNDGIISQLGDNKGRFFLVILAIFSARNSLIKNIISASDIYHGYFKTDKADSDAVIKKIYSLVRPNFSKDNQKLLHIYLKNSKQSMFVKTLQTKLSTYFPNLFGFLNWYINNNYEIDTQKFIEEMKKSIMANGNFDVNKKLIGLHKIFSFTINLLAPNYSSEDTGWSPVTMDRWMFRFFYPTLDEKDFKKAQASPDVYLYISAITKKYAKHFGMTPSQMQAVIWVGFIRQQEGADYNIDFSSALKSALDVADEETKLILEGVDEFKHMDKIIKKIAEKTK